MNIEFTYLELNQIIKNYIEQKYNYSKIKIKKYPKISQFNSSSLIVDDIELEYSVLGFLPITGKFKLYINGIAFNKEKALFFIKFDYQLPLNVPDFVRNIVFSQINKNLETILHISDDKILILFLNNIVPKEQIKYIDLFSEVQLKAQKDNLIIEIE
jgi:hypothetical protein